MSRKGLLIGCLGGGLVLLAAAVGLFYVNVVKPASRVAGDFRQIAQLKSMNEQVANKDSFTPPADGVLTAEQVARFAAVQAVMRDSLGTELGVLRGRAEQLRPLEGEGAKFDLRRMIESFEGLGPVLTRAKSVQIGALNGQGFSYAEYRWVRESVYRALGVTALGVYLDDMPDPRGERKKTDGPALPTAGEADVPANRELVAPYTDQLDSWRPFLAFGL